jgi:hypothetical protein
MALKTYLPNILKALAINLFLFLYFASPSFLSFLAISLIVFAVILKNPITHTNELFNCS